MSEEIRTLDIPNEHLGNIFGQLDGNVRLIEETLDVTIVLRDGVLKISGTKENTGKALHVLNELYELSRRGNEITQQNVDYALSLSMEDLEDHIMVKTDSDLICHTISGKPVKPKTAGQKRYVDRKSVV